MTDRERINKLVEASERMMFLHMCEQEGITCGQPKPSDWLAAVDFLGQALEPFRESIIATEETNPKQQCPQVLYTENKENVSAKPNNEALCKEIEEYIRDSLDEGVLEKSWDIVILNKCLERLR